MYLTGLWVWAVTRPGDEASADGAVRGPRWRRPAGGTFLRGLDSLQQSNTVRRLGAVSQRKCLPRFSGRLTQAIVEKANKISGATGVYGMQLLWYLSCHTHVSMGLRSGLRRVHGVYVNGQYPGIIAPLSVRRDVLSLPVYCHCLQPQ